MHAVRLALMATVMAVGMAIAPSAGTKSPAPPVPPVRFDGDLSVMTYNVHGLPWPVAWGRPAELARIGATLRGLRAEGRNPHVVVLQEAFTADGQAIGREAGYRYVVQGPAADLVNPARPTAADTAYADAGSWTRGEGLGKYVGSGLEILSDFPIVTVRRMAFPDFACAGFDCLANKGALLVSIRLPDRPDPVDIVTTHLNSRHASGVANARSILAYRQQVAYLSDFIRMAHDPAHVLIVAGDFNVGHAVARRASLLDHARTQWVPDGRLDDAYDEATRSGMALSADARYSRERARDWEFYAPGPQTDIALRRIEVPFGHAADGSMLSDHVGYTAVFALSRRGADNETIASAPPAPDGRTGGRKA